MHPIVVEQSKLITPLLLVIERSAIYQNDWLKEYIPNLVSYLSNNANPYCLIQKILSFV